jgi:hypothetical protein
MEMINYCDREKFLSVKEGKKKESLRGKINATLESPGNC